MITQLNSAGSTKIINGSCDMKDHKKYKNFNAANVFLDQVPETVKNEMKN